MKRISVIALLAVAASSLAAAQTGAKKSGQNQQSKAEQEVLQVENARIQAVLQGDTTALDRILADDLVYTHSTARVDTKAQFLGSINSGDLKYESMKHDDLKVRVYGDAAVLTGRSAVKVSSPRTQGQTLSMEIRLISVYAKQNGRWQQVAWQSTRIAQQ